MTLLATGAAKAQAIVICEFEDEKSILPSFVPLKRSFAADFSGVFKEINPEPNAVWKMAAVQEDFFTLANPFSEYRIYMGRKTVSQGSDLHWAVAELHWGGSSIFGDCRYYGDPDWSFLFKRSGG